MIHFLNIKKSSRCYWNTLRIYITTKSMTIAGKHKVKLIKYILFDENKFF